MNDSARIELMKEAIANIEEFLEGVESATDFVSNKLMCHAVTYNLQCIGEGAYKLSRDYVSSHPAIDWEAIEGLRHILVHDYYSVDMNTVWVIIQRDLPKLKKYLNSASAGQSPGLPES